MRVRDRPEKAAAGRAAVLRAAGTVTLAALVGSVFLGACKRTEMASPAQCERLLDRFIDLKMSENPRATSMSSEDRARLRGQIASDVSSDSDVQQVKTQCQTEVTSLEFKCAIAAATSRAWNDCID